MTFVSHNNENKSQPTAIPTGWSFACQRRPGAERVRVVASPAAQALTPPEWHTVLDRAGYLTVPFDAQQEASEWIPADLCFECTVDELIQTGIMPPPLPSFSGNAIMDASTHRHCLEQMMAQIDKNHLTKVILSRILPHPATIDQAADIYHRLCAAYPQACVYWFYTPRSGMWMGATPELLLRGHRHDYQTVALAGTRSSDVPPSHPWNAKELEEQALVSRFIHGILGHHAVDDLQVKGPFTAGAGSISHLKTEFTFTHRPSAQGLARLLADLHPTPAVCGLPKHEALAAIHAIEPHQRHFYGGFQGETGHDRREFYVTIRCMQHFSDQALIYVGGGITRDSVAEDEWTETELKARTLLAVLKNM